MNALVGFKIFELSVMAVFATAISGVKRRTGMVPLVKETLTNTVKFTYALPLAFYAYALYDMERIYLPDLLSCPLTLGATILVVKARLDLANSHTWTGYYLKGAGLVTEGVYAYVRHPLYLGIQMFIMGGFLTVVLHCSVIVSAIVLCVLAYVTSFLIFAARRESEKLTEMFGDEFLEYKKHVHAFLPLRRYREGKSA